jgi:dimeric dUTPase (all-alpha-NTP-PPase superfamily)
MFSVQEEITKKMIGGVDMWGNIMATQQMIDQKYITGQGFKMEDLEDERQLAIIGEMMEYADDTRCFKYWSNKEPESKDKRLDEIADVIHFYAGEFNRLYMDPEAITEYALGYEVRLKKDESKNPAISSFVRRAIRHLIRSGESKGAERKLQMGLSFANFMTAVRVDGFSHLDVERMYYIKSKKNSERKDHNI